MSAPTRQQAEALCHFHGPVVCACDAIHAALVAAYERGCAETQFRPLGDNHHNAAACPYCRTGIDTEKRDAWIAGRDAAATKLDALELESQAAGNYHTATMARVTATSIRALEPPGGGQ